MINSKYIHKVLIVFIFIALLAGCGTEDSQSEQVPPLPEIAEKISGQTYLLDANPADLLSISLTFPGETEAYITTSTSMDESQVIWDWSPVGLDDTNRYSPGPNGIPWGIKGWWESDETFEIVTDSTDSSGRGRVQFTFEGEQITIELSPPITNGVTKLTGRLEE